MGTKKRINISHKHRCFFWTPPKTASTTASIILKNFDFKCYEEVDNKLELYDETFIHNHDSVLFEGNDVFDLILTIRNPYEIHISRFKPTESYTKVKFVENLYELFSKENLFHTIQKNLGNRKPNYILRVENLLEDYSKIPFIRNSEFFKTGKLNEILNLKHNKTLYNYNWKDFYDKDVADLVYYNNIVFFDSFGYDRNSWKK